MEKLLTVFSVFIILAVPILVYGAQIKTGTDNIEIVSGETVEDDLYIASGTVNVDGTISGDLVAVGGQISVSGDISGDVFVIGAEVTISGNVSDDVRVLGGNVTISGNVEDDVIAFGGAVDLTDSSVVNGDVKAGVGSMVIAGEVGSVEIGTGLLTLKSTARILGEVVYTSETEATIETGANIEGGITFNQSSSKDVVGWIAIPKIYSVLTTLLVALLFIWFMPNKANRVATDWKEKFGPNLLWGFLFIVAVPVIIILTFITVLGAPLGLMALPIYGIMLYLAKVVAVVALGIFIQSLINKDDKLDKVWIGVIIGVLLYYLLKMIPFVGWLVIALIYVAAMGTMVKFDWNLIKDLKKKKTL